MATALRQTPDPEQQEREEFFRKMSRDQQALDRQPVAMIPGDYGFPLVVTRDGACFQLQRFPEGEGETRYAWRELVPVPGSARSMAYTEGPDGDSESGPFLPEDGPVREVDPGVAFPPADPRELRRFS